VPRSRPPEQLDIPLVWEAEPPPIPLDDEPRPAEAPPVPCGVARLLVGAAADLGIVLLVLAVLWIIVALEGIVARDLQLIFLGLAGFELASVVAMGCLWGWRGTPGMLLMGVGASRPLSLGRAFGLWASWFVLLPLLGAPLAVGRRGRRLVERLAGSPLSCP
jgi:hypothetical protein